LPKGSKFDYVIEKAVELGVDGIVPFLSDKNIIKLSASQAQSKLTRWENLAKAAAKQSGRATLPALEAARQLKELEARLKTGLTLFLDTAEKKTTLKTMGDTLKSQPKWVNIVVGPESDFTAAERALLLKWGAIPVSLGPRVLRTETSGLVALSILNHELGI
jgi:16S rRNA (uracil1498-N3)-methyltransferase